MFQLVPYLFLRSFFRVVSPLSLGTSSSCVPSHTLDESMRGTSVGHTGIYNILKKRDLTTAKACLESVRKPSGEIVTQDEITRDKEKAKNNHVEANYPSQMIGQDTFYIGCLKGIGRIYHQVAGDCFSSAGAANVDDNKVPMFLQTL